MSDYIYKFYNEQDEVIYIGKTTDLQMRFNAHRNTKSWWHEVSEIKYIECQDNFEMTTYERYYIRKFNPKYNVAERDCLVPRFTLSELDFKKYELHVSKISFQEDASYTYGMSVVVVLKG
jgi:excinuclease UvrABC nuclease subunit